MNEISLSDLLGQISIALDAVEGELLGATKFHSKRVAIWAIAIGKELHYNRERLFYLASAALLHDSALTEYILSEKNSREKETSVRTHCILGEENCKAFPFYDKMKDFVLYHHEWANGKNAFGKKEGEYPQEAGIIALADQMDVKFDLSRMDGIILEQLKEHLVKESGESFSEALAQVAIRVLDDKLLEKCKNEFVELALKNDMPEYIQKLNNKEIIALSGIFIKIIDYKSEFTQEHSLQIANKAWHMSLVYGYSEEEQALLYLAAALHDIGKLFTPIDILEKPGELEEEEFKIIKEHVYYTYEVLQTIRGLEQVTIWASDHHEKLDGTGYPRGKKAEELDFNSRLLACLDIYQAVREKRPYHSFRTHEETMEILYHMAQMGFIDKTICKDLGEELTKLPKGYAERPQIKF